MVFTVQPKCSFEIQVYNSCITITKRVLLLSFNAVKHSSYTPCVVGTYAYSFEFDGKNPIIRLTHTLQLHRQFLMGIYIYIL